MTRPIFIPVTSLDKHPPTSREIVKPKRSIKVGLVQLNNSFSDQFYLPLSAGMLQAYAQKHLTYTEDYEFAPSIYTFMRIEEASELLSDCAIIGISSYVWNEENSLAIARDYKRRNPNGIVVFGGPQVPDSKKQFRRVRTANLSPEEMHRKRMHFTKDFHRAHPFIDMACHGEGERVFKVILEQMAIDGCFNKSNIPSISYVDSSDNFNFNPKLERMNDHELAETPSPFITGVFDKLMAEFPNRKWINMYETDRGCPFQCTYCDWGGATEDRISRFPMEQIYADLVWTGEHKIPYVFLCNANFGILERDIQIAEYFAEIKSRYGYLEGVSTQNTKNPKKHTVQALKILQEAGLNKATVMSQQSLNPATLKAVRRNNMKLDEYYEIQKQLAEEGIFTMTDIILPMPEETYQSISNAISTLIANGQHNRIQFNNLSILRNTEMGDSEYQERYGMEIIRAKIINGHGKKNDLVSGVEEYQELVVATNTMPRADWIKARILCWMVNLVYFNKLLQIPIITLHEVYGIPYSRIFEALVNNMNWPVNLTVFKETLDFFHKTAGDIQNGQQEEFIHSSDWLDIWWPVEEYAFIKLCVEQKLGAFYIEAQTILSSLSDQNNSTALEVLTEATKLNHSLIKMPFQTEDLQILLSYNIWNLYKAVLQGKQISLVHTPHTETIDRTTERWLSWDDWYQKMVWWSNRRGAYLYGNKRAGTEIAGHH